MPAKLNFFFTVSFTKDVLRVVYNPWLDTFCGLSYMFFTFHTCVLLFVSWERLALKPRQVCQVGDGELLKVVSLGCVYA